MIPVRDWRDSGRYESWRGRRIFLHDEGSGPVLILIHGFPTCSWDWSALWPELTARYRCLALDMLGFGFSDKPRRHAYSLFEQADLHEELVSRMGISSFHVLAHDYGDTVLQELMARQKEGKDTPRIESAYMLNGGIIPGQHRPRFMQRLLASPLGPVASRLISERGFRRSFSEVFAPGTQPTEAELHSWWEQISHNDGHRIMHRLIRYMRERRENYDRWVGLLTTPPVPLRFFAGDLDPVSGRHMAECFGALGPNQDWGLIEGIGHYPQTEAPSRVFDDYLAFRARVASP
ncbi:MAG: hypothetical protein RLZZ303_1486 [Candidatus Hydrogenedentota bacterium]|jgi:pimeloyl-ACP methyl ester carboxylesterase